VVAALAVRAAGTHWPLAAGRGAGVGMAYLASFRTVFAFGAAFAVLVSLSQHAIGRVVGRFLSARALYPISQLAYAAYLCNPIVCAVVHPRLRPWLGFNPIPAFMLPDRLATFAWAAVVYLLVERPFMELRPRGGASRSTVRVDVPAEGFYIGQP